MADRLSNYPELLGIGKALAKSMTESSADRLSHNWVGFGKLRAENIPELLKNLEEAVKQGYLETQNGRYRLKGKNIFNAFQLLSESQ